MRHMEMMHPDVLDEKRIDQHDFLLMMLYLVSQQEDCPIPEIEVRYHTYDRKEFLEMDEVNRYTYQTIDFALPSHKAYRVYDFLMSFQGYPCCRDYVDDIAPLMQLPHSSYREDYQIDRMLSWHEVNDCFYKYGIYDIFPDTVTWMEEMKVLLKIFPEQDNIMSSFLLREVINEPVLPTRQVSPVEKEIKVYQKLA